MSYQIKIPSCIFGGAGSIENVKAVIEKENAKKVIIFTDKGIRSTGLLDLTFLRKTRQSIRYLMILLVNHHIRMLKRL